MGEKEGGEGERVTLLNPTAVLSLVLFMQLLPP